jgi:predicted O-linked N-acetylglucosamine transferase (SPINDLY family)
VKDCREGQPIARLPAVNERMSPEQALSRLLQRLAQAEAGAIEALVQLINAAVVAGRRAFAEHAIERGLALAPQQPALLARRAALAALAGRSALALEAARAALAQDPGETMAAVIAIDLLVEQARPAEALALGAACLARRPDAALVRRARSQAWLIQGHAEQARADAEAAVAALAHEPAALSNACMSALYDERLDATELARLHRELGARMPREPASARLAPRPPHAGRALRVGFVSADLRQHPMGWMSEPLLAHLDRAQFAVHVYARQALADAHTARLRALPLVWHDVTHASDAEVHARIQRDAIDVLVDLGGHTHGARPRLFAARAAPCQAAWLGYPYTSGLPNIDALIGDAATLPPGCEPQYRERLLRLPETLMCLPPPAEAPAPAPASTQGPFRFGSFNHLAKLSPNTVALWSEVLRAVPDARLVLCAVALGEPATRIDVRARFAACGVDPERLELLPPRTPLAAFLRYYERVDLGLDPLPFNGGTTTLQALWQGVPTLTLPGASLPSRMGLSILRAAGLEADCVARDAAHYVALARAWAARRDELAALRVALRGRLAASALYDGARFARGFADVLREAAAALP